MQRKALFAVLLLLPACDAAVTAEAEAPRPVVAVDVAVEAEAEAVALAAVAEADAGAKLEISADAFKLGEVTALIQAGTIESAAELELAVNDPEAGINRVDIDFDGEVDHVQVVEVREDARVDFQFRVVPSSKATVEHSIELATASVVAARATSEVAFSASFSASVGVSAGASAYASAYSFVAPARFEASAVIVAQPLLAWAFVVERPMYASIFVEAGSGRWIPPGHLKHGHWKANGEIKGRGHGGFGGKGHGGKGHGKFDGAAGPGKGHGGSKGHGGASHGAHKGGSHKGGSSHAPKPKGGGSGGPGNGPKDAGGGGSKGGGSKGGGGKGKK